MLSSLEPEGILQNIEAVLARLEHSDEIVRMSAVQVLGTMEPEDFIEFAADAVVARLEDSDCMVRRGAVQTLIILEETPRYLDDFADDVAARLKDSDACVRLAALRYLCKLKPQTLSHYVDALFAVLEDLDPVVMYKASQALEMLELEPGNNRASPRRRTRDARGRRCWRAQTDIRDARPARAGGALAARRRLGREARGLRCGCAPGGIVCAEPPEVGSAPGVRRAHVREAT